MKKDDKNNKAIATKTPDELFGRPTIKSGSAYASTPPDNPKNPVAIDYANLDYKSYPNKVKLFIKDNEERFPAESKVPPYKKYNKEGKYIKNQFIATEKKTKDTSSDKKKLYPVGINKLMRENSANSNKKKNVRRK